jgi:hypothetical protein
VVVGGLWVVVVGPAVCGLDVEVVAVCGLDVEVVVVCGLDVEVVAVCGLDVEVVVVCGLDVVVVVAVVGIVAEPPDGVVLAGRFHSGCK